MPFHLADLAASDLAVIALAAFLSSILGGLSGYGVGLILPVFLAPVLGVVSVIPVMSIAMTMTNASRVFVFRREIAWRHAGAVMLLALPLSLLGAYIYTLLNAPLIGVLVGGFLLISVPLRRALEKRAFRLGMPGMMATGAVYGFLAGGMSGTGLLLLSALMAAGVQGAGLIGTDAIVATLINIIKATTFGAASLLDFELFAAGILIGCCTAPGAFVARWLLNRIPIHIHTAFMDGLVIVGGTIFMWQGFR